ncbi:MAG: cupin domain-containing protein [Bryobacteraceae bacterium]
MIIFTPRRLDYQTKHLQDELYVVMRGSGTLLIQDQSHAFREGDVLFVPASTEHRFVDFTDDLITWAIFWRPPGANRGQHLAGVSKILLSQLIVSCDSEGVAEKQGSRRTTFCCSPPSIKNPLAEHGDSA